MTWSHELSNSPITVTFGGSSALHLLKSEATVLGITASTSETLIRIGPVASAEYKATQSIGFNTQFKYHFLQGEAFQDPITGEGTNYNTLYVLGGITLYP